MIKDKAQIEKWREEFESHKSENAIQRDYRNEDLYWNDQVQYQWQGFLLAKQNMPIVELPNPVWSDNQGDIVLTMNQISEALDKAGIKYNKN